MERQQSLHKDILAYIPAKVIPAVCITISIWLLAKILKGEGYINYSFLWALGLICFQIVNGWLNSSIIYLAQQYKEDAYLQFRNAVLTVQFYLLVPVCIILYLLAYLGVHAFLTSLLICGILSVQMIQAYCFSFFQVERKIKHQTIAASIQSITQLSLLTILFFSGRGSLNIALAIIFISFLFGNIYAWNSTDFKQTIKLSSVFKITPFTKQVFASLLQYGLFVCIWFFASQLYLVGDRLVLKFQHVSENVAGYTAFRDLIIGVAGLLTMPILMASHPQIMKMWHDGEDRKSIAQIISSNIRLITVLFMPVFVVLFFSGEWIVATFLGKDFGLSASTQVLVAVSVYLNAVAMYVHKGFEVNGNTKQMAGYALLTAVISFGLNTLLIKYYGVKSCAAIAVLSQIVYISLCLMDKKNVFKITIPVSFFLPIILYVAGCFCLLYFIKPIVFFAGYIEIMQLVILAITGILFILFTKDVRQFIYKLKG